MTAGRCCFFEIAFGALFGLISADLFGASVQANENESHDTNTSK